MSGCGQPLCALYYARVVRCSTNLFQKTVGRSQHLFDVCNSGSGDLILDK